MTNILTVVISEARNAPPAQRLIEGELASVLAGRPGIELKILPPLCDLRGEGAAIGCLRAISGDMVVLGWLYPRAAYWLLRAHGIHGRMGQTPPHVEQVANLPELGQTGNLPHPGVSHIDCDGPSDQESAAISPPHQSGRAARTIWCIDLRAHKEASSVLLEIEQMLGHSLAEGAPATPPGAAPSDDASRRVDEATVPRWCPVIDHAQCTNCLECLNFCLFGVFGLDEVGQIMVEQPDACRDGCPACSRICPANAIMFPEYADAAIAGDASAPAAYVDPQLQQYLDLAEAQRRAAAERSQALSAAQAATGVKPAAAGPTAGDLDHLVEELDATDL